MGVFMLHEYVSQGQGVKQHFCLHMLRCLHDALYHECPK